MIQLVLKVVVNAIAIWVAAAVLPGVEVRGENADLGTAAVTVLVIGLIFGLVNAVIKFLVPFEGCLYAITLGVFAVVLNAAILELTAYISNRIGISFTIDHFFWSAIFASLIVSVVSLVLHIVLPDDLD